MNLEEEAIECETVSNKLKGTLESLDILQSNFSKLELKHIKTCSEFKSLKDDHDGLAKDFTQSKITIKTLKKEATELISEHQKTAKKKNDIIEDLMKYKADKCSEERDLKIKQKKLNKKLKQVEERECKLRTAKNNLNRKEVDEADADNNNDIAPNQTKPSLASNSRLFTTAVTYSIPRDSSSSHSMVSHWLPDHVNKFDRSDPSSKGYTANRQGLTSNELNSSDHSSTLDFLNTTTLYSDLELLKTIIEKFDKKFDDVSKKLS